MKVCQYCDTLNPDDAAVCRGCGAGEFYHQCVNCGALFDGFYCPDCGVKANAEPSVCPDCGRRYYTASCPHCGYSPARERQKAYETARARLEAQKQAARQTDEAVYQVYDPAPEKPEKKHTFRWILGWLFVFPLPLTILLFRKKSGPFGTVLKILITVFAWALYISVISSK